MDHFKKLEKREEKRKKEIKKNLVKYNLIESDKALGEYLDAEYLAKELVIFAKENHGVEGQGSGKVDEMNNAQNNIRENKYYCFVGMYNKDKTKVKDIINEKVYEIDDGKVIIGDDEFEKIQYQYNITFSEYNAVDNNFNNDFYVLEKKCYFADGNTDLLAYLIFDDMTKIKRSFIKKEVDRYNDAIDRYYRNNIKKYKEYSDLKKKMDEEKDF